ncbi:CPBP family intramembrane glutamic endopeptidase [Bifidobacterium platyrrhinorum]|uniref:CPBP family intramembrane metalloprotease n=1 Tax=Bifidobacterium platyrrhinorum TaxID=2661628 RepID=A0A6L9STJ2_9BIFI|nr:type II CAAX endopeptidase family protein [Bifidobacterium platyrrhinorum]NEG55908.1 CPBP family intramembrane metalloprotease [Bifidobacterium platyrrhinorum]
MSDQQSRPAPQHARTSFFEAHRRFTFVGIGLCVMIAFWVGLNIVLSGLLAPYFPGGAPSWLMMLISSGPLYLVAMPMGMTVLSRVPALKTREFPLGGKGFWTLLIACFPIMMAGNIIGTGLSQAISGGASVNRVSEMVLRSDPWVNALFVVLLAPLFEEWLFRKQIIDRTRRYGERTAIVLSAFAFALFHMNLYQFFYAFGIGLVLAYAYMRTSRLRYPVIMHMVVNASGSLLAPGILALAGGDKADRLLDGSMGEAELMRMAETDPSAMAGLALLGAYGLLMFALTIAGIVLICRNLRRIEFYDPPERLPKWYGARLAFLNPGMIAYVALTVVLGLWQMGLITFGF